MNLPLNNTYNFNDTNIKSETEGTDSITELVKNLNQKKELETLLQQTVHDQLREIAQLYKELQRLVEETDSQLSGYYIKKEQEKKLPRYIVREGVCGNEKDIIFLEDEIVLFMNFFTADLITALQEKYSKNILVLKGVLSRDPIEIHIKFSEEGKYE